MKLKPLPIIAALALATGCATVTPEPTGGSKADGIVEATYYDSTMVNTTVNDEGSLEKARERCQAWGYSDAERFGGATRTCASPSAYGCDAYNVTLSYQCTD